MSSMKAVGSGAVGVALYGVVNSILDAKFTPYYPVTSLMLALYGVMLPAMVGIYFWEQYNGSLSLFPTGWRLVLLSIVGVLFLAADRLYLGALAVTNDPVLLTMLFSLMPVVPMIVKYFLEGDTPTKWHLAAFVLAICVAACLAMGNKEKSEQKAVAANVTTTTPSSAK